MLQQILLATLGEHYCFITIVTFDVLGVEKDLCMSVSGAYVMLLVSLLAVWGEFLLW